MIFHPSFLLLIFWYDYLMTENILNQAKNIHFIGIGGIGISAIARMLLSLDKEVSGSDSSQSEITNSLKKMVNSIHQFIRFKKF